MKPPTYLAIPLLALSLSACSRPPATSSPEVVALVRDELPGDPEDSAWDEVPFHTAELLRQDMVEPRLLETSTPSMDVRAITDGRRIAFRLAWNDATRDDLPGASRFVDACAIQLPTSIEADVPAPQMGEEQREVEISYWRASWQAAVDGREDTIQSLYPGATVDHYPFEAAALEPGSPRQRSLAAQYAPARALGHGMEGPRDRAVEDLLAQGPGTLTPAEKQHSSGSGRRREAGWAVVIERPLPAGLRPGGRTQVAVAVWDGAHDEVGARKMRSGWIPLHIPGEER